jgi:hypothetical protein
MAEVHCGCAQPPHAPGDVREVLEQLDVGGPGLIMVVAKASDLHCTSKPSPKALKDKQTAASQPAVRLPPLPLSSPPADQARPQQQALKGSLIDEQTDFKGTS